jgi:hypothetical protein
MRIEKTRSNCSVHAILKMSFLPIGVHTVCARYAIEIQRSLHGDANHVLSAEMTKQMLVAGEGNYGLGLEICGSPENPYFTMEGSTKVSRTVSSPTSEQAMAR